MSKFDPYYAIPLAILHSGDRAVDALENAVYYGTVNTGFGYLKTHKPAEFNVKLMQAKEHAQAWGACTTVPEGVSEAVWKATLVGRLIHNVSGVNLVGYAQTYEEHHRPGEVFFRISDAWLWAAYYAARHAEGYEVYHAYRPLSWREFRLLAALLSAKVNKYGFTFQGWESLQARACGYHSKKLFQAGQRTLPPHCKPLTRDMIRSSLNRMEALRFFARCRYATGARGGLSAYSFRHKKREDLIASVLEWRAVNQVFQAKTAGLRAADLATFQKAKPQVTPQPDPQAHLHVIPQPPPQSDPQHKEKGLKEKG